MSDLLILQLLSIRRSSAATGILRISTVAASLQKSRILHFLLTLISVAA
jgi:hypothetical protein